jgi:hypothetical protein
MGSLTAGWVRINFAQTINAIGSGRHKRWRTDMKADHKAAKSYALEMPILKRPANLAAAYLELRELAIAHLDEPGYYSEAAAKARSALRAALGDE